MVFFLELHILVSVCLVLIGVLCLSLPLWLRGTPGPPPGKSPLMPRESLEPSGNSSMAPWTPPAQVRLGLSPGEEGRTFSTAAEAWQRGIPSNLPPVWLPWAPKSAKSLSRLQSFICVLRVGLGSGGSWIVEEGRSRYQGLLLGLENSLVSS